MSNGNNADGVGNNTAMVGNKEGNGKSGKSNRDGNEDGGQ